MHAVFLDRCYNTRQINDDGDRCSAKLSSPAYAALTTFESDFKASRLGLDCHDGIRQSFRARVMDEFRPPNR